MLTSLALVFLSGLALSSLCKSIKLPGIIGMLSTGIILGPFCLDLLDSSLLMISSDLRELALIIILLKAGLSLKFSDIKKVGRPALLMSFLPAAFEISAYVLLAGAIFHISIAEAALLGAVLSAVSPAVVIPRMVKLMDEKIGTNKGIPQMIMAGASCDDIFVIVLFTTFLGMAKGERTSALKFLDIPLAIILGIAAGCFTGWLLTAFFEREFRRKKYIRNSLKVIIILGFSFLMMALEDFLEGIVPLSGFLAVVSMAAAISAKGNVMVTKRLSEKFGKLWLASEVILFVLVGAAVDIRYTLSAGFPALLMIAAALILRSLGVYICLLKTKFNFKEKLFAIISYIPKATVQAAIGSVPLSAELPCGKLILSVAVLAIIVTAPLGALGMDMSYKKLLSEDF